MQIPKKIAAAFTATGLFAASLVALPFGGTASAKTLTPSSPADFGTNEAVDVQTELNCTSHTLTTKITNKTSGDITPDVTFNEVPPSVPPMAIEPGKTAYVMYSYSGNNMPVAVEVAVDTYEPVELNPTLSCNEPVSFFVTQASESAVGGMLTNNSTLVAQVALTQASGGDVHVESLEPGETRFVAIPYKGYPNQTYAFVTIGTTTGFQSTYSIDLTRPVTFPPAPEPKK